MQTFVCIFVTSSPNYDCHHAGIALKFSHFDLCASQRASESPWHTFFLFTFFYLPEVNISKIERRAGEILQKDDQKSLTPRTRQIRGSLCSSKLDFDIDDLCTLTLRRGKEREREREWERKKRRRACAGNFSSRRFDRPSETNFRFSSSIILRLPRWHLTPRLTVFFVSASDSRISSSSSLARSSFPPLFVYWLLSLVHLHVLRTTFRLSSISSDFQRIDVTYRATKRS